jgi:hypothetical protein
MQLGNTSDVESTFGGEHLTGFVACVGVQVDTRQLRPDLRPVGEHDNELRRAGEEAAVSMMSNCVDRTIKLSFA